jgi:uncharacterized protein (DUF1015 family)
MADIRAFCGVRYNLARVGALSDVVAPPYDVIGPELQDALYARHPANVVRMELNKERPGDDDRENRYTRAGRHVHDWRADNTLVEEPHPSLYVLHQRFEAEGRAYTRRGFLARLKLEPFGEGRVFPHEETMPGPKADRLRLFHATGMNVSPVFGLYPDSENEVQELLESAVRGRTPLDAVDHLGVVSHLWPISDLEVVTRARALMGPKAIFIADGHHRYETSVRYRDERRAAGAVRDDESNANFVLMACVGMSDPGLVILPTHRLVSGLAGLDVSKLRDALGAEFDLEDVGVGPAACREAWALIEADGGQNLLGFGAVADGRWMLARLRGTATMDRIVPQHSPSWRGLAVSILHELVIGQLLVGRPTSTKPQFRYVHLVSEVLEGVAARTCDLACLVPPATMDHVQQIASSGERMPAKSTYFYPKLLTGLVFNPIA